MLCSWSRGRCVVVIDVYIFVMILFKIVFVLCWVWIFIKCIVFRVIFYGLRFVVILFCYCSVIGVVIFMDIYVFIYFVYWVLFIKYVLIY